MPRSAYISAEMRLLFCCAILAIVMCCKAALPCSPECQSGTGTCEADHGILFCKCLGNWSGDDCSTFICDSENPCLNDGVCSQHPDNRTQYLCSCPLGFAGPNCEYRTHSNQCNNSTCNFHGKCYEQTLNGAITCVCDPGYWGLRCEHTGPDQCQEATRQCNNRGTCLYRQRGPNPVNDVFCECDQSDIYDWVSYCRARLVPNYCHGNPCKHGGTCSLMADGYNCTCPPSFTGVNCTVAFNACEANRCQNGGTCNIISDGNYYNCSCPPNYSGYYCESALDPCMGITCQNGGTCLPDTALDGNCSTPACQCPAGFTGRHCEVIDHCASSACGTHSTECLNLPEKNSSVCVCEGGWGGPFCSLDVDECSDNPCNRGTCVNTEGGFTCECEPGSTGPNCELLLDCTTQICENGGTCEVVEGGVGNKCVCPPNFTGTLCEIPICPLAECEAVAANGECDRNCFSPECNFDGREGVCFTPNGTDPWVNCPHANDCRSKFNNSQCDVECNIPECLYDAHECVPENSCPTDCEGEQSNGRCNKDCNTAQCPYDYDDCNSQTFADDILVLILITPVTRPFINPWSTIFLNELGRLTNSNPVVIENITLTSSDLARMGYERNLFPTNFTVRTIIYQVKIRLDIEYCQSQCPTTADDAVRVLQAYYSTGHTTVAGYTISDAYAQPGGDGPGNNIWYYVGGGICLVVLAALILGVIIGVKRKRISAKVWRPPSPASENDQSSRSPPSDRRRTTQAGAMVGTEAASITHSGSDDYIAKGSKKAKMTNKGGSSVRWTDLQVPIEDSMSVTTPSATVVLGQTGQDERQWNSLHYSAMRNPRFVKELAELYRQQNGHSLDVNAPGPGGYTPLMLAVTKRHSSHENVSLPSRSSSDSSGDFGELASLLPQRMKGGKRVLNGARPISSSSSGSDTSTSALLHEPVPAIESSVTALIDARADLDVANDYGQTALHLAAGCSRGDYVEMLLDAGSDPNVQDNWNQSPLQAAIGAAAEGAFMVLLNHPKVDINLKSDGGITPLMAAVKVVNQFMVKQLLKKNVDIATTDNEGRTAVHWAAMVDNLEALKLLIRQGPDTLKDAQDNKGQTALFLACREGCASCVKHLLDCFANVTLLDTLDRSPLQMAYDKQHLDIVEMLKTSAHGPVFQYPLPSRARMPVYSHAPGMPGDQEAYVMHRPVSGLVRSKRQAKSAQEHPTIPETVVSSYPSHLPGHHIHQQQHELAAGYLGPHTSQPVHQTFGELTNQPTSSSLTPLSHPSEIPLQDIHPHSSSVHTTMHPTTFNMTHHSSPSSSSSSSQSSTSANDCQVLNTTKVDPVVTSGYNTKTSYGVVSNGYSLLGHSSQHSVYANPLPVSEPTTSCYTEPTATLSDVETLNEVLTSMADDVPYAITSSSACPGSTNVEPYNTNSVDQLQSVGYSMPNTTSTVDSTQLSGYPESSGNGYTHASDSYRQTVYKCCSQSTPLSAILETSSYNTSTQPSTGSTQPLQHLPIPVNPSLQYTNGIMPGDPTTYNPRHQPSTTSVGKSSRSPPSYFPSPPNCNDVNHYPSFHHPYSSVDPPSLTPSPESRDELKQCVEQFTTESYVEGQIHDYHLPIHQPHFITHHPVPPCESHV